MNDTTLILIGAAALAFAAKNSPPAPLSQQIASLPPQEQAAIILSSPTGQAALDNISQAFGEEFTQNLQQAILTSNNAGEVLQQLGYVSPSTANVDDITAPNTIVAGSIDAPRSAHDYEYLLSANPPQAPMQQKILVSAAQYADLANYIQVLKSKAQTSNLERKKYFETAAYIQQSELDNWRVA